MKSNNVDQLLNSLSYATWGRKKYSDSLLVGEFGLELFYEISKYFINWGDYRAIN